jgi:O-antigen/teichoic acid export membrane protein
MARMTVLPLSAVLGMVVTRMLIDAYGPQSYAQYLLLVSMAAMLPFADLGISAPITNAVAEADDPRHDEHLYLTLVSALRIAACCAAVIVAVALTIGALDLWPAVLGDGLVGGGSAAATACLAAFGITLLVAFGQRVLVGLHLNHLTIWLKGLQTPLVLLGLWIMISTGLDGGTYVAVLAYAATFLIAVVTLAIANRKISPTIRRALRGAWAFRTIRGAPILGMAAPMTLQMIAWPLAMQTDKVVLSHVAPDALAEYSLAGQIFLPLISVISAAGTSLWPHFAKERAQGTSTTSPLRVSAVFAAATIVLAAAMAFASGPLASVASGGRIHLSTPLVLAFIAYVVVSAAWFPLGSFLTDAPGLRFQAFLVTGMLPVNLALSWWLGGLWGAPGPVVGSTVGVGAILVTAVLVQRARLAATVRRGSADS